MPVDTSIYSQIQPVKYDSPLNALASVMQVQHAQGQNKLAELMLSEKQREADATNTLNDAYKNALGPDGKIDRTKLFSDVAQRGAGAKLPAIQKAFTEQDKATADLDKSKIETAKKRLDIAGQAFGFVRSNPTAENANAALDYLGQNGIYTPEQVAEHKAKIAANPGQVAQMADMAFRAALDAKDQIAKYETKNTGATTDTIQIDPVTGKTAVVNRVRNTVSPDAALQASTSRANNAANIAKDYAINGMSPDGTPAADVETMARGIADGKIAPLSGFSLARPRGQAIMARVMELNPSYDAGDYAAKNSALKGFAIGKEGTALRSFNVAVAHLDTLGQMADALDNGNHQLVNKVSNAWKQQTGQEAPTNFDAVKEIVGKEVVKAIVAGGGGVSERQEVSELMSKANSPAQLKGVITHFKELMDAQKAGLLDQYQRTTGRTDGETVFAPSSRTPPPGGMPSDIPALLKKYGGK